MTKITNSPPHNFSTFSPDYVLNALNSIDFCSDGHLLVLNSYENRVYQIGMRRWWQSFIALALDNVRQCFARAGNVRQLRLHSDCHMGNVLWTDTGPYFVDFDDSRMGPAIQDLWMLLSDEHSDIRQQLNDVLAGYEVFYDFNERELRLIEALRILRLIHYAAWLARRWDDPAFQQMFSWFNTQRYWRDCSSSCVSRLCHE